MGLAKLIRDLTAWTTHTQKHWIEVQNDDENTSKKAELDWKILRSIGVKVTNISVSGNSTVSYTEVPLDGQRFLVTVSADIAPSTTLTTTFGLLPEGLRPKYVTEISTYFLEGSYPDRAIKSDRKLMAYLVIDGDESTGTPGRVRIMNQHTYPRTISLTYVSNPL